MHMSNTNLEGFSNRLKEILADNGYPGWGRQRFIAQKFGVSHPSAKKWLDGVNYPEMDKLVEFARWGNTTVDWLITGEGLKHPLPSQLSPDLLSILEMLSEANPETVKTAKNVVSALLGKQSK